jgi:hypothetical protein
MCNNVNGLSVICQRLFNKMQLGFSDIFIKMAKSAFLGLRVSPDLRKQLEQIAQREERSISQVCEVLLRGGVTAYQKEGSKYVQRLLSGPKDETDRSER